LSNDIDLPSNKGAERSTSEKALKGSQTMVSWS
jgi:hypothetical protein